MVYSFKFLIAQDDTQKHNKVDLYGYTIVYHVYILYV